ncbi:MAG: hypothetical protein HDR01_08625 [Lachnospiraceae bacterium]|nr:hypothetical protein [Lachnospiraceae bacterium]
MKRKDLLQYLKGKHAMKVTAAVLAAALLVSSVSVYHVNAERNGEEQEEEFEEKESENETEEALSQVLDSEISDASREEQVDKEETVYVISDAKGNAKEVIVSDWLKNPEQKASLPDASDLEEIENVKGDETFTKGDNHTITWQADGADIYYQGKTEKKVPVEVKITYYLEDKEIAPEELAGKSGNVKIRFDYVNKEKQTITINGKEEEIYVPFTVLTGMMLPTENFKNVTVKNGKVLSEGNHDIVVGVAFPGLKDSLAISSGDLGTDMEIPDYVEVSARVTDFSLDMTMSAVLSDVLSDVNLTESGKMDELNDSMDELSAASGKLVDGSGELKDGVDTLHSKTGDLKDGADSLSKGVREYTDGVGQLSSGIGSLKEGTSKLNGNVPALLEGVSDLNKGTKDAKKGADSLVKGYQGDGTGKNPGAAAGAASLAQGAAQLSQGMTALSQGVEGMFATIDQSIGENQANAQAASQAAQAASGALEGHLTEFGTKVGELMAIQQQLNSVSANSAEYAAYSQAYQAKAAEVQAGLGSLQTIIAADVQSISDYSAKAGGALGAVQALQAIKEKAEQSELTGNVKKLSQGANQVAAGAEALDKGINGYTNEKGEKVMGLAEGTASLQKGLEQLAKGTSTLNKKGGTLKSGVEQLDSGAGKLSEGVAQLTGNSSKLTEGANALSNGAGQFAEGVEKLKSGAEELNNGMIQFDEEGIQKLTDTFNGDIGTLLDRLEKIKESGENYNTFTALPEGSSGKVKFVIKTEGIK